jgi:hypothetical protein
MPRTTPEGASRSEAEQTLALWEDVEDVRCGAKSKERRRRREGLPKAAVAEQSARRGGMLNMGI